MKFLQISLVLGAALLAPTEGRKKLRRLVSEDNDPEEKEQSRELYYTLQDVGNPNGAYKLAMCQGDCDPENNDCGPVSTALMISIRPTCLDVKVLAITIRIEMTTTTTARLPQSQSLCLSPFQCPSLLLIRRITLEKARAVVLKGSRRQSLLRSRRISQWQTLLISQRISRRTSQWQTLLISRQCILPRTNRRLSQRQNPHQSPRTTTITTTTCKMLEILMELISLACVRVIVILKITIALLVSIVSMISIRPTSLDVKVLVPTTIIDRIIMITARRIGKM